MARGGLNFEGIGIQQATFKAGAGIKALAVADGRDSVVGIPVVVANNNEVDLGTDGDVPFGFIDVYENDGHVGVSFRGFVTDVPTDGNVTPGRICLVDGNGVVKESSDGIGTKQSMTVAVTTKASSAGNVTVKITAAGSASLKNGKDVVVALDTTSTSTNSASIRQALGADADVAAFFDVSGTAANIILTAKVASSNDTTMAFALTDTDTTGAKVGATTDVAGVPDNKIGLPIFINVDNTNETATVFLG